jgi:tRNA (Uracil-5-)-methyltransferase
MSVQCLGSRAQSLLSHLFARQIGLRSSGLLAGPHLPQTLSCTQILQRQLGLGTQQCRRASRPLLRAQQRRTPSIARLAVLSHAATSMTQQEAADADADALPAAPAPAAGNGAPATAAKAPEDHAAEGSSAYEQQLAAKVAHVRELFNDFALPELEIFRSAPNHYRLRYLHSSDEAHRLPPFASVESELTVWRCVV